MTATTLANAVKELERLKHSRAVWLETVEHLSRFLDREVRTAEQGIVADGCVVNRVPQPVIREFIDYINQENIDPLNERIEAIEQLTVMETKDNDSKEQHEGGEVRPKANEGPKIGSSRKKLRTLPNDPGRKAQGGG